MLQSAPALVSTAEAARLISLPTTLTIDARPPSSFAVEHVRNAILPPSTEDTIALPSHCHVLVYDTGTTSATHHFSRAVQLIARLRPALPSAVPLALISGGLHAIRCSHPHLIHTPRSNQLPARLSARLSQFPWAIRALHAIQLEADAPARILPNLYLGAHAHSTNPQFLHAAAISHILSVGDDFPPAPAPPLPDTADTAITRLHIPLSDTPNTPISEAFPQAIDFLEQARLSKSPALVHCRAGASRSVALVLAYLVWLGWPLQDAIHHVKARRPAADPNHGFVSQLTQWQYRVNSCPTSITTHSRPLPKLPFTVPTLELTKLPQSPPLQTLPYFPSSPITPTVIDTCIHDLHPETTLAEPSALHPTSPKHAQPHKARQK